MKLKLYSNTAKFGSIPTSYELSRELGVGRDEVESTFKRLEAKRLLVLEPGDQSRIRMAPPFSGVETTFPVQIGSTCYFANCVWDALGVAAALHSDAQIDARDGHTGEPITLEIRDGRPTANSAVSHFAVPAALWWRDIIYT